MDHAPELFGSSVFDVSCPRKCCVPAPGLGVLLLSLVLLTPLPAITAQENPEDPDPSPAVEYVIRAPFPLGSDAFLLMPGKRNFYVYGSLENHELDGVHVVRSNRKGKVTRNGVPVRHYPDTIIFRVTASTEMPEARMDPPFEIEFPQETNQLLDGLRFDLKVFRGLDGQELQPSEVRMIGIPSDQPSDERVYRVSFLMHDVPVDARLALEVCTPSGERITRFRIELL